jgi:hypothetical protein
MDYSWLWAIAGGTFLAAIIRLCVIDPMLKEMRREQQKKPQSKWMKFLLFEIGNRNRG